MSQLLPSHALAPAADLLHLVGGVGAGAAVLALAVCALGAARGRRRRVVGTPAPRPESRPAGPTFRNFAETWSRAPDAADAPTALPAAAARRRAAAPAPHAPTLTGGRPDARTRPTTPA